MKKKRGQARIIKFAHGVERAVETGSQVLEGVGRYLESQPRAIDSVRSSFTPTLPSIVIRELPEAELREANPITRAIDRTEAAQEAFERGDIASATESILHARDAVHEVLDTVASALTMILRGGFARRKVPPTSRKIPRVRRTRPSRKIPRVRRTRPATPQSSASGLRHHGLTAEEVQALRRVRVQEFNLPAARTTSHTTMVGELVTETGERIPIHSGKFGGPYGGTHRGGIPRGRGEAFTGGGQSQGNIASHVEGHAAAIMHQRGIVRANLLIEAPPCSICSRNLPTALPPGSRLTVVDPHSATTFWSAQRGAR